MSVWIIVLSAIFTGLGANQFRNASLTGSQDIEEEEQGHLLRKNLTIAWIEKLPYTPSRRTNGSQDDVSHVLIRNVLLPHILLECGVLRSVHYQVEAFRADSEFHMLELLTQNKVNVAAPI